LRKRPRYAAAVEDTIAREPGVISVEATPTTGRLLVHHDASQTAESLRTLIEVALSVAPLTLADYGARQPWGIEQQASSLFHFERSRT
jgi:hypothetical protein